MSKTVSATIDRLFTLAVVVAVAATSLVSLPVDPASAQESVFRRDTPSQRGRDRGQYIPTISITPDGCEVWVMDDGAEGYAVEHVRRDGTPVCRDVNLCGVMNSDQYFATDSYRISSSGKARLQDFFRSSKAFAYIIVGHTDSRASDEYNLRLSYNRANSVAAVAQSVGARIVDVRGMGERVPAASNATAAGMAKNRRVEIMCIQ